MNLLAQLDLELVSEIFVMVRELFFLVVEGDLLRLNSVSWLVISSSASCHVLSASAYRLMKSASVALSATIV